jgi:hypothetical protein
VITLGAGENADKPRRGGLRQGETREKAKSLEVKSYMRKIPRKISPGGQDSLSTPSKSRRDSSKGRSWSLEPNLSSKIYPTVLIMFADLYDPLRKCIFCGLRNWLMKVLLWHSLSFSFFTFCCHSMGWFLSL